MNISDVAIGVYLWTWMDRIILSGSGAGVRSVILRKTSLVVLHIVSSA